MSGLVLLAVVGTTYAAPAAVIPHGDFMVALPGHSHIPITYISQHHTQGELGQANHGFAYPGQSKKEVRDASGNVVSVNTYSDVNNNPVNVAYTPALDGFRVNNNNLHKDTGVFYVPVPVRDTPEVTAAKLQFMEAYNAAATAAATGSTGVGDHQFAIVFGPKPVQDTPEVTAAKLEFVDAYNAAAVAAALAPDDPGTVMGTTVNTPGVPNIDEADQNVESNTELGPVAEPTSASLQEANIQVTHDTVSGDALKTTNTDETQQAIKTPDIVGHVAETSGALVNTGTGYSISFKIGAVPKANAEVIAPVDPVTSSLVAVPALPDISASGNVESINTLSDVNNNPVNVQYTAAVDDFHEKSNNIQKDTGVFHVPVPVRDTPEVTAAKLQFMEAYNAAAIAAATGSTGAGDPQFDTIAGPKPVKDTPEVTAAKLKFMEAYNSAAIAAAVGSTGVGDPHFAVVVGPKPVKDTPEVTAAKLKFMEAYNSAAITAALASDDEGAVVDVAFKDTSESLNTDEADKNIESNTELGPTFEEPTNAVLQETNVQVETPVTVIQVHHVPDPVKSPLTPEVSTAQEKGTETDFGTDVKSTQEDDSKGVLSKPNSIKTEQVIKSPGTDNTDGVVVHTGTGYNIALKVGSVPGATGNVAGVYKYVSDNNMKSTSVNKDTDSGALHVLKPVRDTPEVTAAKLEFVEAYNAAAIAAALAPDDQVDVLEVTGNTSGVPKTDEANENVESNTELGPTPEEPITEASQNTPERLEATGGKVLVQTAPGLIKVVHTSEDENIQNAFGNVASIHTHNNANNFPIHVVDKAGADSFQVRSNNLHEDTSISNVPKPIKDSPEVTAKLNFLEAYNAAATAAATGSTGIGDPQFFVVAGPKPVKDTPEVTAAKLEFVEAYNAAAIAAATGSTGIGDPQFIVIAGPKPVKDTPEVTAAKLEFVEAYNAAAIAAATGSTGIGDPQFIVIVGPKPVKDTPEVTAAKLNFVEAYNTAAIAAALAPDEKSVAMDITVDAVNVPNVDEAKENVDTSTLTGPGSKEPATKALQETSVRVEAPVSEVLVQETSHLVKLPASPKAKNIDNTVELLQQVTAIDPGVFQIPEPVRDTADVTAAKLEFLKAYNAAAIAAATGSTGVGDPQFITVVGPKPVKDTPEVTAAKLEFMDAYNAAAIAAALAPDVQSEAVEVTVDALQVPSVDEANKVFDTRTKLGLKSKEPTTKTSQEPSVQVKAPVSIVHVQHTPDLVNLPASLKAKITHDITEGVQDVETNTAQTAKADDTDNKTQTVEVKQNVTIMGPGVFHVPEPVKDTPEVIAAKLAFVKAYNAAAIAAATGSTGVEDSQITIGVGPQAVKDTPEVTAAKLDFMKKYNAAALAAALAPDDQSAGGIVTADAVGIPSIYKAHETLQTNPHQFSFNTAYSTGASISNFNQEGSVSRSSGFLSPVFPGHTNTFPYRAYDATNNPHLFSFSLKLPSKQAPQQQIVPQLPPPYSSNGQNYFVRYTVPYT